MEILAVLLIAENAFIVAVVLSYMMWPCRSTTNQRSHRTIISRSATTASGTDDSTKETGDSVCVTSSWPHSVATSFTSGESQSVKKHEVRNGMTSRPSECTPLDSARSSSTGSGGIRSPNDTLNGHRQSLRVTRSMGPVAMGTERNENIIVRSSGGRSLAIPVILSPMMQMQKTQSTVDWSQEVPTNAFFDFLVITDSDQRDQVIASPQHQQSSRALSPRNIPIVRPHISSYSRTPRETLNQSKVVETSELIHPQHSVPNQAHKGAQDRMYPQHESNSLPHDDDDNEGDDERRQQMVNIGSNLAVTSPELLSTTNSNDRSEGMNELVLEDYSGFDRLDESKMECVTADEVHLEAVIGRGQSLNSNVFRARWRNTQCAAKRFPESWFNASKCKQYIDEVAIKLVDDPHENVLKLLAFHFEPFTLLSEFMNMGSAKEYTKNTRPGGSSISILDRIEICNGIAKGIQHLHSLDIVHSEINAQHALVHFDDESKMMRVAVTDYALQIMLTKSELVIHRSAAAVVPYLAPECFPDPQAEDSAPCRPTTKESDIYALGITMWEVIIGQEPYRDLAIEKVAVHVLVEGGRPQNVAFIPEKIQNLMRRCWHKEKEKRPSAAVVVAELTEFIVREWNEVNVFMC